MLPREIVAFGAMNVPVTVQSEVTVTPRIEVNVEQPTDDGYDTAMKQQSALGGSGSVIGGSSK